jgi:hypothetical protein
MTLMADGTLELEAELDRLCQDLRQVNDETARDELIKAIEHVAERMRENGEIEVPQTALGPRRKVAC